MSIRRRALLTAGLASLVPLSGCGGGELPAEPSGESSDGAVPKPKRIDYGDTASSFGELYLPTRDDPLGTVVVIHGGFWQDAYALDLGAPLAADLAARGFAAWNLEYRRLGDGGGWPNTFTDVADGIDHLDEVAADHGIPIDRVLAVGHSAGGQLAVWAACRGGLPEGEPGADPVVRLHGVVSQSGVLDLRFAAEQGTGGGSVEALLGGEPDERTERYALASPVERLPIGVAVRCVHTESDDIVPVEQSRRFVDRASDHGDDATVISVSGDHFAHLDLASEAWTAAVEAIEDLG